MTEAVGSNSRKWGILVFSYDGNSDLWPLFFHFLFKSWPDVPTPIYLITNFKTYDDPRVVSLQIGKDLSWAAGTQKALDRFPFDEVWVLLEDFFMKEEVTTGRVEQVFSQWRDLGGRYLETHKTGSVGKRIEGTPMRAICADLKIAGFNSALYTKQLLREVARPGLNLWQTHTVLGDMNRANAPDFYYFAEDQKPLLNYEECVRGKFWKTPAMEFLRVEKIEADFKRRPYPVQSRTFFGKLVRSFYKRIMRFRIKRESCKLETGWSCTVLPLDPVTGKLRPEKWLPPRK